MTTKEKKQKLLKELMKIEWKYNALLIQEGRIRHQLQHIYNQEYREGVQC